MYAIINYEFYFQFFIKFADYIVSGYMNHIKIARYTNSIFIFDCVIYIKAAEYTIAYSDSVNINYINFTGYKNIYSVTVVQEHIICSSNFFYKL